MRRPWFNVRCAAQVGVEKQEEKGGSGKGVCFKVARNLPSRLSDALGATRLSTRIRTASENYCQGLGLAGTEGLLLVCQRPRLQIIRARTPERPSWMRRCSDNGNLPFVPEDPT